jgi:protein-S-isoprenylcysteine O-methyltransferase Ste14
MDNKILNYLTLIIIVIGIPALLIKYFMDGNTVTIYSYIGLVLIVPGFILLVIARLQLGSSFHIIAQANKLVTKGLYNKFRHPIYYSGFLLALGICIFIHSLELAIIFIVIIFIQMKRIRNEEKVLEEKFGAEYVEYKKNTWF